MSGADLGTQTNERASEVNSTSGNAKSRRYISGGSCGTNLVRQFFRNREKNCNTVL